MISIKNILLNFIIQVFVKSHNRTHARTQNRSPDHQFLNHLKPHIVTCSLMGVTRIVSTTTWMVKFERIFLSLFVASTDPICLWRHSYENPWFKKNFDCVLEITNFRTLRYNSKLTVVNEKQVNKMKTVTS